MPALVSGAVLWLSQPAQGRSKVTLDRPLHVLGRTPYADVGFENIYVSRRHAEITYSGGEYWIRDLGSRNGTFVDGLRVGVHPRTIPEGALIELGAGHVGLTFRSSDETLTEHGSGARGQDGNHGDEDSGPGIHVDIARRSVFVRGKPILKPLSPREFDVLALLYRRAGEPCHKDEIARAGWRDRVNARVGDAEISQCIHRIRKKVEIDPGTPRFIELSRGYGYVLNLNP